MRPSVFTAATVRPSPPSAEAPACDRFRRAWESGPSAWHHRHRGRGHRDRRAWTRDRPYHGIGWGPESCEGASDGQVRGECCGDTHGSRRFQSSNHNVPLGRHEDTLVHSESQSHQRGGDDHQRSHDILQSPTTHRCAYKRSRPPPPHASQAENATREDTRRTCPADMARDAAWRGGSAQESDSQSGHARTACSERFVTARVVLRCGVGGLPALPQMKK